MNRKDDNESQTLNDFHGNWCGPGWTAGKQMNAEDMTVEDLSVPAVDVFDRACKNHDIFLAMYPERAEEAHDRFSDEVNKLWYDPEVSVPTKIKALLAEKLVHSFGPRSSARKLFFNLP